MESEEVTPETPEDESGPELTLKQRRFIDAYLGVTNGNATEAARAAGYDADYATLRSIGSENLTKPNIRAAITRRLDAEAMPANEVLAMLARQAKATIADLFEMQGGKYPVFNFAKAWETGGVHNVRAVTPTPDGQTKIEMVDSQAALIALGRHHKLFTDKTENNNPEALEVLRDVLGVQHGVSASTPIPHGDTEGTSVSQETI